MSKKNKIIIIVAMCVFLLALIIFIISRIMGEKEIDVSNAGHAVTINDNVDFYKKMKLENVKIYKELKLGTNVYVLEEITDEEGNEWSRVAIDNTEGYILSKDLGYYTGEDEEKVLMVDVSKFNYEKNFDDGGEFGAFIVNYDITYVYIRAGGRGYGTEGNFYTDTQYKLWADECEFLGVPFGFYFLDEALDSEEIDEEVEFITNFLEENEYENMVLPISLDIEKFEGGRAEDIWEERATLVSELLQKLSDVNIDAIIYSNANIANQYLSSIDAKFWLAYYPDDITTVPTKWYTDYEDQEATLNEELMSKMIAWQFSDSGAGREVPRLVDLSLIYKNFAE